MLAASVPSQRPPHARLLAIDRVGNLRHMPRPAFLDLLRPGDLVVANDAATLPASLAGDGIEVAACGPPVARAGRRRAVLRDRLRRRRFPHAHRGPSDAATVCARRSLGARAAPRVVEAVLDHPRLLALRFEGSPDEIRAGLARHGRPIQYAHVPEPLALWDVWTPIAGSSGSL